MRDHSTPEIPYGYCHCGCGRKTNIARKDWPEFGHVKGEPMRYLRGHTHRSEPYPEAPYSEDPETGCWNWNFQRDKDGYGMMWHDGKRHRAHRFYYEARYGKLPDGMVPDHLCRNTSCVNPDHMRALTISENSRWKSSTKLDWEKVAGIRLLALQGISQHEIARRYGIAQSQVHRIVTGKRWAA